MQIFATTLDYHEDQLVPTVLVDAEGRSDIAILLSNPLFAMSAVIYGEWMLKPQSHISLRIEVQAYSIVILDIDFPLSDYGGWLNDIVSANVLRVLPVVHPALLEQTLIEPGAPGVTIRNFSPQLKSILADVMSKNRLF